MARVIKVTICHQHYKKNAYELSGSSGPTLSRFLLHEKKKKNLSSFSHIRGEMKTYRNSFKRIFLRLAPATVFFLLVALIGSFDRL